MQWLVGRCRLASSRAPPEHNSKTLTVCLVCVFCFRLMGRRLMMINSHLSTKYLTAELQNNCTMSRFSHFLESVETCTCDYRNVQNTYQGILRNDSSIFLVRANCTGCEMTPLYRTVSCLPLMNIRNLRA